MKITFVSVSNVLNGGVRVIGIVASELAARGHDVELFIQPHRHPTLRARLKALVKRGKWLPTPKDGPFLDAVLNRTTTLATRRPVVDVDLPDADVVIATWWETAPWVNALSPTKGAKVYFMQDYGAPGQEIDRVSPTWELPFTFVTLTRRLRDMILDRNPTAFVAIMRNAADPGLFNGTARPRGRPPKIGLTYRPQPSKGMDTALAALAQVRSQLPDLKAVAVTPGPSQLPGWIEQVRRPDDQLLAEIYRSCELWLFPSRLEGFGLPIIEAMASRTPVVSTLVGGAPDLIEDGTNGYLVDIGDADAMAAKAIEVLSGAEARWDAMAAAAQATAKGLGWSDAVDVFEQALLHAVSERAKETLE